MSGVLNKLGKVGNMVTGGFFGQNADNQAPFSYDPLVGKANTTAFGNYNSLYDSINSDNGGFVKSVVDPIRQANALGYGNLLQDQGLRGVRGSSFGDQSISNFQNDASNTEANATIQALMQKYGLLNTVNTGIAGFGNNLAAQGVNAQNANTGIKEQNLKGNQANMKVLGDLFGALKPPASKTGGG